MDLSLKPEGLERLGQQERVRVGRFDPLLVAVFAAAVCAAGAGWPSLWFDEPATISASTRSVPELHSALPDHQSGDALDPGPRLRRAPAYQVPNRLGFHIVERWQFSFAQVAKSAR